MLIQWILYAFVFNYNYYVSVNKKKTQNKVQIK